MNRPPTHCPNCNARQAFKTRVAVDYGTGDDGHHVSVYISCDKCKWMMVLFNGPQKEWDLKKKIIKTEAQVRRGSPARRLLRRQKERLRALRQ